MPLVSVIPGQSIGATSESEHETNIGTPMESEVEAAIRNASDISSHAGVPTAHHDNSQDPTVNQKAALKGTGTPGEGDPYVSDSDSRNTDARTPTAHTHVVADVTDAGEAAVEDVATGGSGDLLRKDGDGSELTGISAGLDLDTPYSAEGGRLSMNRVDGVDTLMSGLVENWVTLDTDFWTIEYTHPGNQFLTTPGNNRLVFTDNETSGESSVLLSSPWMTGVAIRMFCAAFAKFVSGQGTYTIVSLEIHEEDSGEYFIFRHAATQGEYRAYLYSTYSGTQWEGGRPIGEWIGGEMNLWSRYGGDGGNALLMCDNAKLQTYRQLPPGIGGSWQMAGRRRVELSTTNSWMGRAQLQILFYKNHTTPTVSELITSPAGLLWLG